MTTRAISPELKAHYAQGTTTLALCVKATLVDETVVAATSLSEDVIFEGVTYASVNGFTMSDVTCSSDLSVDNLEISGFLRSSAVRADDVLTGRWDHAEVEIFEVNYRDTSMGRNILHSGRTGELKAGRSVFTQEARGLAQQYSRRIGELTTVDCRAVFGDNRCKIDKSLWTVLGSVDTQTNDRVVYDAGRTEPDDWFTKGTLTWLTGRNAGRSMEVKSYSVGAIELFEGMPNTITAADTPIGRGAGAIGESMGVAVADTYSLVVGCQKRFYQDCIGKFANPNNFQGEPHVPGVGVFGGPGTVMIPVSVPGSGPTSPPPPPSPSPAPGAPAPSPGVPTSFPTVGPYAVTLPAAGPDTTATPTTTDSNGDATIAALIAAGGTTVSIPTGIYVVHAAISVPAGKTLQAASGVPVTIKAANAYAAVQINLGVGASITNFTIDGNYANRAAQEGLTETAAVVINGAAGASVTHMRFVNVPSYGVWVYNSPGVQINYNVFDEVYQPLRIDGANVAGSGTFEGNAITNTAAFKSIQHIDAINTKSFEIKSNTLRGAGSAEPTSHGTEGTWGNSIYLAANDATLVENNTVSGDYWSSIVVGAGNTNATVQYNRFDRGAYSLATAASWIEQPGCDTILFTKNILTGGLSCGDTGGNHLTITYNDITAPAGSHGIDANGGFKQGTISHNRMRELGSGHTAIGMYLWEKSTADVDIDVTFNSLTGFHDGIYPNNSLGVGTIYGLNITGNSFTDCTSNITISGGITVDASCTIQTESAPVEAAIPFGSRSQPLAAGAIQPTDSTGNMDAFIQSQYNGWVAHLLRVAPGGLGSIPAGGMWVQFSDTTKATVSEGMGYGMLITALMGGYDGGAQDKFDGLLATAKAFRCTMTPIGGGTPVPNVSLMSWQINANGTDGGGAFPALDGDLDIAMALLMANAQWGSDGTYDYATEAANWIAAIKTYLIHPSGVIANSNTTTAGRTSDYMFGHFKAFKNATGDSFWDTVIAKQKTIIDYLQTHYAPATGLIPDWAQDVLTATPRPADDTGDVADGGNPHKGEYWYNACRDPWRMGTYFALTGDAEMKTYLSRMEDFFVRTTGGTVTNLINGYALDGGLLYDQDGRPIVNNPFWIASEFYNSMMVGAMCDARFQPWLNALWTYSKAHPETGYYGTEIQLLCAIVVSGNWWTP